MQLFTRFLRRKPALVGVVVFVVLAVAGTTTIYTTTSAASPLEEGVVTFTFDDARLGIYTNGAPTLAKYGIKGTFYGVTDYITANYYKNMTWEQVQDLQNTYKWEIGNHTTGHQHLNSLTVGEVRNNVTSAHQTFVNHGITPQTFSYPFGEYNSGVIDVISDYYMGARRAWGGPQGMPMDQDELRPYRPTYQQPAEEVIAWIDQAVADGKWVILEFHNIVDSDATPYEYPVTELEKIAAHVASKGYKTPTVAEALGLKASNKVPNGNFDKEEGSWVRDWTRSNEVTITPDNSGKGAYPSPQTSIFFDGGDTKDIIRTKELIPVAYKPYNLSMFVRVENFVQGGFAIWVNEYDEQGTWLSGQWLGGLYRNYLGTRGHLYMPTSEAVKNIQLTLYTNAGSDLDAYIDSVRLAKLSGSGDRPSVSQPITDHASDDTEDHEDTEFETRRIRRSNLFVKWFDKL